MFLLSKTGKKFPVLMKVYNGPESSLVDRIWYLHFGDYLVSRHKVVYIKIDGRGTGLQSEEYQHELYKQLGTVEVEDQVSVCYLVVNSISEECVLMFAKRSLK